MLVTMYCSVGFWHSGGSHLMHTSLSKTVTDHKTMHLATLNKLLKDHDKELKHLERFITRVVYLILRQCLGGW